MCARFDGGRLSSDGGVLLLREIERRLGIAELLGCRVTDERDPASTTLTYADMIWARMFAIACGYEDCDDVDALRFDPAFFFDSCDHDAALCPETARYLEDQLKPLMRLANIKSVRQA